MSGPPERTYSNMVRTAPLEMEPLASSNPSYLPILFIIPTLMLLKNPTHRQRLKKKTKIIKEIPLLSQIGLYYCVFLHHEG